MPKAENLSPGRVKVTDVGIRRLNELRQKASPTNKEIVELLGYVLELLKERG